MKSRSIIATLVAAVILLILGFQFGLFSGTALVRTKVMEKQRVDLPDGSFVHLNADSKVRFNTKKFPEQRIISLEGEGMFYVKRGGGFLVKTKQGLVRVLGTNFNIYARSDGFRVSCYLGKVEARKEEEIVEVNIGESVSWDGSKFQKSPEYNDAPFWTLGEATFMEAPLIQVIDEIKRQFGVQFKLELEEEYFYTGSIPHNSLQVAMDNIAETFDLTYKQKGAVISLSDQK